MSVKIAWKQNILVTDFQLLKSLLVVFGFGSQTFVCGFSRQNICSVDLFNPKSCTKVQLNRRARLEAFKVRRSEGNLFSIIIIQSDTNSS